MKIRIDVPNDSKLDGVELTGYIEVTRPTKSERNKLKIRMAKIENELPEKMVTQATVKKDDDGNVVKDEKGKPVKEKKTFDVNEMERVTLQMLELDEVAYGAIVTTKLKLGEKEINDKLIFDDNDELTAIFIPEFMRVFIHGKSLGKN